MKTNDYIKFLTEQFVSYVDQPKETRKIQNKRPNYEQNNMNKWFGLVPFALMMTIKRKKK